MTPWKNGYYKMSGVTGFIKVDGNQALMLPMICYDYPNIEPWEKHTWTHGDYGPTCPRMKEASGADKYNMEITSSNALSPPSKGVVRIETTQQHCQYMPITIFKAVRRWKQNPFIHRGHG